MKASEALSDFRSPLETDDAVFDDEADDTGQKNVVRGCMNKTCSRNFGPNSSLQGVPAEFCPRYELMLLGHPASAPCFLLMYLLFSFPHNCLSSQRVLTY